MCPTRSHTLAFITILTSNKKKFKWNQVEQDDFKKINWIVARDTLSTYLYFNETFKINTNARMFQLGAIIIQKGKPIASHSRKITDSQIRYTFT